MESLMSVIYSLARPYFRLDDFGNMLRRQVSQHTKTFISRVWLRRPKSFGVFELVELG